MEVYKEFIIELYRNPLNKREIKSADASASGVNPLCGDRIRIYVKKRGTKIVDCSFEGEGCAISTATACLLTEKAKGTGLEEIMRWDYKTIFELLEMELSPARLKCGLLSLETLQNAIKSIKLSK